MMFPYRNTPNAYLRSSGLYNSNNSEKWLQLQRRIVKWCQWQMLLQRGMWQWLTGRVRGAWSYHILKGNTQPYMWPLSQKWPSWPYEIFSFIAPPYSMTLMSVSIASHYCGSHSYRCQDASSCASIYDMMPAVRERSPLQGNCHAHTHSHVCLAVIARALRWLLSLRRTLTLTFTEWCITYKVRSQRPSELFLQPPVVRLGETGRGETCLWDLSCLVICQSYV